MKELLRCKPCGYVISAKKLGNVCPACGMPRKAFEPYRERVSLKRLTVLNLDLHPIVIHLSQTFVVLIPLLIVARMMFPGFKEEMFVSVIDFCLVVLPFTLVFATLSGMIDGLTRFKSLKPPLLRVKIVTSLTSIILSFILLFTTKPGVYTTLTLVLSILCLACAVMLGLWGKKLINVILPGTFPSPFRKKIVPNKPNVEL